MPRKHRSTQRPDPARPGGAPGFRAGGVWRHTGARDGGVCRRTSSRAKPRRTPGPLFALALCCVLTYSQAQAATEAIRYVARLANKNKVGLTVTNYGFFGNNFTSRSSSFEFPLGSGFEHMSRAGLWIGALALSDAGAFTGVTTALVDATQGGASADETEFAPTGDVVSERSRLVNSRVYSPAAISDQDLICSYTDAAPKPEIGRAHV